MDDSESPGFRARLGMARKLHRRSELYRFLLFDEVKCKASLIKCYLADSRVPYACWSGVVKLRSLQRGNVNERRVSQPASHEKAMLTESRQMKIGLSLKQGQKQEPLGTAPRP